MFNFDVVMTPTDSPRPELIAAQPAKYKNVEKDHIFFECSFWDRLTLSVNHFIFILSVLLDLSMGVLGFLQSFGLFKPVIPFKSTLR